MSKNNRSNQTTSVPAAGLGESLESNASVVNEHEVIEGVIAQEEKPEIITEAKAQENEAAKDPNVVFSLKNIRDGVIKIGDHEVRPGETLGITSDLLKNEMLSRSINHGIEIGVYEKV